jgi:hypothetical protein
VFQDFFRENAAYFSVGRYKIQKHVDGRWVNCDPNTIAFHAELKFCDHWSACVIKR